MKTAWIWLTAVMLVVAACGEAGVDAAADTTVDATVGADGGSSLSGISFEVHKEPG